MLDVGTLEATGCGCVGRNIFGVGIFWEATSRCDKNMRQNALIIDAVILEPVHMLNSGVDTAADENAAAVPAQIFRLQPSHSSRPCPLHADTYSEPRSHSAPLLLALLIHLPCCRSEYGCANSSYPGAAEVAAAATAFCLKVHSGGRGRSDAAGSASVTHAATAWAAVATRLPHGAPKCCQARRRRRHMKQRKEALLVAVIHTPFCAMCMEYFGSRSESATTPRSPCRACMLAEGLQLSQTPPRR